MSKKHHPITWLKSLKGYSKDFYWRQCDFHATRGLNEQQNSILHRLKRDFSKYSITFPEGFFEDYFEFTQKVNESSCIVNELWEAIVYWSAEPLPKHIALQLVGAWNLTQRLTDSNQDLDVYFALAEKDAYSRSRLCIRLFIDDQYSVDDLQRFIDLYGTDRATRILAARKPSDESKYAVFSVYEEQQLRRSLDDYFYKNKSYTEKKRMRKQEKRPVYIGERIREEKRIHERWKMQSK